MGYLTADKLINGIEGSVIATINGNVREMVMQKMIIVSIIQQLIFKR